MDNRIGILVVDDDPTIHVILQDLLGQIYTVRCVNNGRQALEYLKGSQVDLILLDVMMPVMDGFETCRIIKADLKLREIPVLFLTLLGSAYDEEFGLSIGAEDFIHKPFKPAVVLARIRTHLELALARHILNEQNVKLQNIVNANSRALLREKQHSNIDTLTELPNRQLFFDRFSRTIAAAKRRERCVALLFLDLDGFKSINDNYGHEAGDTVLKTVAKRWLGCVREDDTVARLGGDEFAVVLGDLSDPTHSLVVANKLIEALSPEIRLSAEKSCRVGASIGIAIYPDNGFEMDSLLSIADSAMYESKKNGKNSSTLSCVKPNPSDSADDWIGFTSSCLVNVKRIDEQHRQLVRLANFLNKAIVSNSSKAMVNHLFNELIAHVEYHFETEHQMMVQSSYPDQLKHDQEHEHLIDDIKEMAKDIQNDVPGADLLTLQKIKDWLLNHILNMDKALGEYVIYHDMIAR